MKTPVEAPAVQPAPYSLLDTAEKLGWIVEGGDAHWEAGAWSSGDTYFPSTYLLINGINFPSTSGGYSCGFA